MSTDNKKQNVSHKMKEFFEKLKSEWRRQLPFIEIRFRQLKARLAQVNWRSPKTIAIVTLLVLLTGALTYKLVKGHLEHDDHDEEEHGEGHIELSDEAIKNGGIEIVQAAAGKITQSVRLPGEVVLHPNGSLRISPRYGGVVREILKNLGDAVVAGDTLAIVESNAGLQRYPLKSTMSGVVTKRAVSVGEYVSESTEAFAVANLDKVMVNLIVYQLDLPKIQKGQSVKIVGSDSQNSTGEIFFVSPVIDADTRTATAAVNLPNPDMVWRPGFFVSGIVQLSSEDASVVVPREAIQFIEDETVVFIKEEDGFEKRDVEIGRQDDDHTEIVDGLKAGETYVSKGAFVLKSELAKGSLEHEH